MKLATAVAAATAANRPSKGIVSAYDSSAQTMSVNVGGSIVQLPYIANLSYSAGAVVLIVWDSLTGNGTVVGPIGQTEVPDSPTDSGGQPSPTPTIRKRSKTLLPTVTDNYRGGQWIGGIQNYDPHQGNYGWGNHQGVALYGTQIAGLHAKTSGYGYSAKVTYKRVSGGIYAAQTPTFWLCSNKTKPSGAPTFTSASNGTAIAVGSTTTWTLPGSWVAALLNGSAGGIGMYVASGSPYIGLAGKNTWGGAFALAVNYYA